MELCVLVGSEVYDIRLNAVWALMVCKNITYSHMYIASICVCMPSKNRQSQHVHKILAFTI